MHLALASMAGHLPFVTLDERAAELPGAELLQA
jgi:predicted nucleic acid-binding protein